MLSAKNKTLRGIVLDSLKERAPATTIQVANRCMCKIGPEVFVRYFIKKYPHRHGVPLEEKFRLGAIRRVSDALAELHRDGVIYRIGERNYRCYSTWDIRKGNDENVEIQNQVCTTENQEA